MADRWSIYAVQIDDTVDVIIGGITAQSLALGAEVVNDQSSGQVSPEVAYTAGQRPVANFTSYHVETMLTTLGQFGTSIDDTDGLCLYAQKHLHGGGRTTGSNHRKYSIVSGMIVPGTLSCNHQEVATMSANVIVTYDGSNDPVQIATSQALPSGALDDERFGLGRVTVESKTLNVQLSGVLKSLTIDFGVEASSEGGGGDVWDTHASIITASPKISFTATDLEWFTTDTTTIPIEGLALTHDNTVINLREYAQANSQVIGHGFTADGSSAHIDITSEGLMVIDDVMNGSQGSPAEISATIHPIYDGTNDPLVITTDQTIA